MSIPAHRKAFWVGRSGPVLQPVPHGAEIEIVREMPDRKFRVKTKPGQGLVNQEWDAFHEEVVLM